MNTRTPRKNSKNSRTLRLEALEPRLLMTGTYDAFDKAFQDTLSEFKSQTSIYLSGHEAEFQKTLDLLGAGQSAGLTLQKLLQTSEATVVEDLDADSDGVVSLDELVAGAATRIQNLVDTHLSSLPVGSEPDLVDVANALDGKSWTWGELGLHLTASASDGQHLQLGLQVEHEVKANGKDKVFNSDFLFEGLEKLGLLRIDHAADPSSPGHVADFGWNLKGAAEFSVAADLTILRKVTALPSPQAPLVEWEAKNPTLTGLEASFEAKLPEAASNELRIGFLGLREVVDTDVSEPDLSFRAEFTGIDAGTVVASPSIQLTEHVDLEFEAAEKFLGTNSTVFKVTRDAQQQWHFDALETALKEFRNVSASNVVGQLQSLQKQLGAIASSPLFSDAATEGTGIQTGVMKEQIGQVVDYARLVQDAIFSQADGDTLRKDSRKVLAKIDTDGAVKEIEFYTAQELQSRLSDLGVLRTKPNDPTYKAVRFENHLLEIDFAFGGTFLDRWVDASFDQQLTIDEVFVQKLNDLFAGVQSSSRFRLEGKGELTFTLGLDLAGGGALDAHTTLGSLRSAIGSQENVETLRQNHPFLLGSAIPVTGELVSDIQFQILGVLDADAVIDVSMNAVALNASPSIDAIVTSINQQIATKSTAVTAYKTSEGGVGFASSTKELRIVGLQDAQGRSEEGALWQLRLPSVRNDQGEIPAQAIAVADSALTTFGVAILGIQVDGVDYSLKLNRDQAGNTIPASTSLDQLLAQINGVLSRQDSSTGHYMSEDGISAYATSDGRIAFRAEAKSAGDKKLHTFKVLTSAGLGFTGDKDSEYVISGEPLLALGRLSSDLKIDLDFGTWGSVSVNLDDAATSSNRSAISLVSQIRDALKNTTFHRTTDNVELTVSDLVDISFFDGKVILQSVDSTAPTFTIKGTSKNLAEAGLVAAGHVATSDQTPATDDFLIEMRSGAVARIDLSSRKVGNTRVAIDDATELGDVLSEIADQVMTQTGSAGILVKQEGGHLVVVDSSNLTNPAKVLRIVSFPESKMASLLGIEGTGSYQTEQTHKVTIVLPAGTAATPDKLLDFQGRTYRITGVLDDGAQGVGVEVQANSTAPFKKSTTKIEVRIAGGQPVLGEVTDVGGSETSLRLVGQDISGKRIGDRLYIKDLDSVAELGVMIQEKHVTDRVLTVHLTSGDAGTILVGSLLHIGDREYRIDNVSGDATAGITLIFRVSSQDLTAKAADTLHVKLGDRSDTVSATVVSVDSTSDATKVFVAGRNRVTLNIDSANYDKVKELKVDGIIQISETVNGHLEPLVGLKIETITLNAATKTAVITFLASRHVFDESVSTTALSLTIPSGSTTTPGTAFQATCAKKEAVAESVEEYAKTVTLSMAGTDLKLEVGQSIHIGGDLFRISAFEEDATANTTEVTFRTGGKTFAKDKRTPAFDVTFGLESTTHSAKVVKIEGMRRVTIEVNPDDPFVASDAGQFVTIDGHDWRIARVDEDRLLDFAGRPVLRNSAGGLVEYDDAGIPKSKDGQPVVLAKYLVLEVDYENFKAAAPGETAETSAIVGSVLSKPVTAQGVQLSAELGPLGVHLLGQGSIGRRAEFSITGKVTADDLLDLVLLRNQADGLMYEDLRDGGFSEVFSSTGWTSSNPTQGDATVHLHITDRSAATRPDPTKDEAISFRVVGEGLSGQSDLANLKVWFDKTTGMPQTDFVANASAFDISTWAKGLHDLSFDKLLDYIEEGLGQIEAYTGHDLYKTEIPGTGKTVGEMLDLVQEIRDVVSDLRKNNGEGTLDLIEHRIERLLGLQDDEFDISLVDQLVNTSPTATTASLYGAGTSGLGDAPVGTVVKMLRFDFHVSRRIHDNSNFSFKEDSSPLAVGGGAELYTEGWFDSTFSFGIALPSGTQTDFGLYILKDTEVKASFDVTGRDLKFNLGISGIGALSNLLQVEGRDGKKSYLAIHGDLALATTRDFEVGAASTTSLGDSLTESVKVNIGGNLPVFVAGNSLGEVQLGTWDDVNNKVLSYDTDTAHKTLGAITTLTALKAFQIKTFDSGLEGVTGSATDGPTKTAPDGSLMPATADIAAGTLLLDVSSIKASLDRWTNADFSIFEMLKLAVDGLDMTFSSLEEAADSALNDGFDVPLLRDALSGGADFLTAVQSKLIEPLREFIYDASVLDEKTVADFLLQKLSAQGILKQWQQNSKETVPAFMWGTHLASKKTVGGTTGPQVAYEGNSTHMEWAFTLGGTYNVGDDFDLDLGLPGLGLQTHGGVGASIEWTLNLGFGFSREAGFYLLLPKGNDLELTAKAEVEQDTTLGGSLGFLELSAKKIDDLQPIAEALAHIKLDLNKGAADVGSLGIGDVSSFSPDLQLDASAQANILLTLGLLHDQGGGAPKFPNLNAEFHLDWDWQQGKGLLDGLNYAGFSKVTFDMGGYVDNVLRPFMERIQKVIEPIEPLIDFLTSPIPILSDISSTPVTMLDLAKLVDKDLDVGMIQSIRDLIDMIHTIGNFSGMNGGLPIGDFALVGTVDEITKVWSKSSLSTDAKKFLNSGVVGNAGADIRKLGGITDTAFDKIKGDILGEHPISDSSKTFQSLMDSTKGQKAGKQPAWAFPIINDPSMIFGLLLGKDVDLVTYDMAPLIFDFTWSQYFPIVGPIGARIGITLGADIDLAFGYDTQGIRRFIESDYSNYLALVDGFYVADLAIDKNGSPTGADIAEVSLHGGLFASAELNLGIASGGVGGGLNVDVNFNLNDPDHDGKVRLYEMWENVANEYANNDGFAKVMSPFAIFDIDGRIYAQFYAYIDTWLWSETWNITPPIEIYSFNVPFSRAPRLAHEQGNDVVLNLGANSEGRLNGNLSDGSETVDVSLDGDTVNVSSRSLGATRQQSYKMKAGGKLLIDSGDGNDSIVVHGSGSHDIEIAGGKGDDTIDLSGYTATGGQILLVGGAGSDTIKGSNSAEPTKATDVVTGDIIVADEARIKRTKGSNKIESIVSRVETDGSGNDILVGNGGFDLLIGGGGSDQIAGGAGMDLILGDGGTVTFAPPDATGTNPARPAWVATGTELQKSGGDDLISGDSGNDLIFAGAGNDRVDGGAGNDNISGQAGRDILVGGSGDDSLEGGAGVDVILGDVLATSIDLDLIVPGSVVPTDLPSHKIAHFSAYGSETPEAVDSVGNDTILGGTGSDILFGDNGLANSAGGIDTIDGGIDNDIVSGDGGDDAVNGGAGEDIVMGGLGNDLVKGGEGNDILFGDNGKRDFAGAGTGSFVEGQTKVYGVNLAEAFGIQAGTSSMSTGGNDVIEADGGSDWVDGQGGGDRVSVAFRGGDQYGVVNVRDTGTDSGVDSLSILGTLGSDKILVRASAPTDLTEEPLGVVALLPLQKDSAIGPDGLPVKTGLERVNFWGNTEKVVVDASMGDDVIAIDGTVSETVIQGGSGKDQIRVGQMFRSGRTGTDQDLDPSDPSKPSDPNANQSDPFIGLDDSFATIETTKGRLSHGPSGRPVTIQGGFGDDTVTILHTDAPLSVFGEEGNDTFQAQAFRAPDDSILLSAPINIDGGVGTDSYAVAGTDGDDKFFITKDGILTEGVSASVTGVESLAAEAGAGDDTFYVLGTNAGTDTVIHGGLGSDTVIHGGLAESVPLMNLDLRGHSGLVDHQIVTTDPAYSVVAAPSLQVNIVDNDVEGAPNAAEAQILFVNTDWEAVSDPALSVQESSDFAAANLASYVLQPSSSPKTNLVVTVSAPPVSGDVLRGGGRGILLSTDGTTWSESVTIAFDKGITNADAAKWSRQVFVWAPADLLREGDSNAFLNHTVVSVVTEADGTVTRTDLGPVRSASVVVHDKITTTEALPLVFAKTVQVPAGSTADLDLGIASTEASPFVYWESGIAISSTSLIAKDGFWQVSAATLSGKSGTLVAHYASSSLDMKGANSVDLAYAQANDGAGLALTLDGLKVTRKGAAVTATDNQAYQWVLDGRKILFVSATTKQVVGVRGILALTGASAVVNTQVLPNPVTSIAPPTGDVGAQLLVLPNDLSTDVVEGGLNDSYTLKLTTTPTADVTVKIKPQATVWGPLASNKDAQVKVVSIDGVLVADGVDPQVVFKAGIANQSFVIVLAAVEDEHVESDAFSFVARRADLLDDLDGAVWAEGDGGSSDFSGADPLRMEFKKEAEFAFKSETNNYDDLHAGVLRSGYLLDATQTELDAALLKVILTGTTHPAYADLASGQWAVMFTSGVVETGVLAQIKTIPGSSASPTLGLDRALTLTGDGNVTWRLVKVSKSLFVSEAEQVDRVFVNDRDATVERTGESLTRPTLPTTPSEVERSFLTRLDAQRFNASEIAAKGLNWGDFELAEVNLGHGVDNLDVASAQDRDDGFQVVTIVNAGEGDDQIKVSSYKKAASPTVVSGSFDSESSTSAGAKKFYAKVSMTLPAGFDLSKIGTYWLDLTDSVGGVERRSILSAEIVGAFVNFRLDRAFTGAVKNNAVRLVDVTKGTDGVLSVNAQDGDDTITAYDPANPNAVTGPLVVFGGLGNDTIDVGSSGTVFGDRGQVVYLNETTGAPVTLLGTVEVYEKPDGTLVPILEGTVVPSDAVRRFYTDDTTPLTTAEHQTDGVRRNPVLYRTVQDDVGGNDTIHIVGSDNVVFGGNNAVVNDVLGVDTITIGGGQNIVLGDGGKIVQVPLEAGKSLVWGDGAPARIESVETTSDEIGARDVISAGNGVNGNVMMGGQGGDSIVSGNGNDIILGDGGRVKYQVSQTDVTKALRSRIETKSDPIGASDTIDAGDGDNIVFGGAASDGQVWAGSGRDIMVGDGGYVSYDKTETLDRVSNAGQTVDGGNDIIHAGIGENIVFGGLGDDLIVAGVVRGATDYRASTSDDKDEVVGDNGVRTFLGTDDPSVLAGTSLSFNFQGQAQTGIAANKFAGAAGYRANNWNNIAGPLTGIGASTFGNDPKEILLNAQGERMQGLELSYGGKENHRTDSIELNAYQQENYDAAAIDAGKPDSADGWLFAGGVRTSGPNDQLGNKLEVEMDGLSEYFSSYSVVVYIDAPNNVSGLITNDTGESIRRVGISEGKGVNGALVDGDKYYIDDSADPNNPAFHNFRGTYLKADQKNLTDPRTAKGKWANYVVFDNITADRFVVTIADAIKNTNGLDIPSIAGIQIIGKYNRQNTLASSGTELGGTDTISTSGGDDLVIGGAGADKIATFGDVRRGEDDFDTVIGDDGKVVLMDHALRPTAEPVFATSTSYASSLDLSKTSFDDIVVTGNGNDVVIGGEGQDRVNAERHDDLAAGLASSVFGVGESVPEALQGGVNPLTGNLAKLGNWNTDGLRVTSVNFTYTGRDSSIIDADLNVTSGQIAGAVAASNWNNLIVRDDLSVPLTINQAIKDSNGTTVNGVTFGIQTRNVQNNTQLSFAMGDHYFGHNEIDADSDNARLFESYLWSQKQDQIEVNIAGLNAVNNGGAFDVYVYIDGDDQRTAGDDYAFRVDGNGVQYFLNDWQGNTFNGEFRRVDVKTTQAPNTGVTPDGRMVGNYVVFKNVTGSNFSLKIRNHWYNDQAPLSMPSLAGLQIVAGSQAVRDNLALNGDYDKDVVIGDNGKVRFNLDIPYGVNDDVAAAQNKAVEVESIATTQKAGIQGDVIVTGRNQDLVVGGNGADRIDTGVGDDVVLGDNGRVFLTDYNPIGVRTPTNVAILDNQLQDNSAYIGGMNFNAGGFQAESLAGVKLATSTGGADLIEAGADNDLVYGQEGDDLLVGNEGKDDILRGGAGTNQVKDQAGAYATQAAFQSDMAGLLALLDNAGKTNLNAFVANDYGQTVSLGALATAVVVPPTDPTPPTTDIALPSNTDVVVNFVAGQEVVFVATDWPGKGNAYWKPDIMLALNGNGAVLPALTVSVDGSTMATQTLAGGLWYQPVNSIPDTPPDGQTYRIRVKALQAGSVKVKLTNA